MARHWMGRKLMSQMVTALRRWTHGAESEDGMATAELLGNAALGVLALVAIWGALRVLGLDIVDWIRGQLKM